MLVDVAQRQRVDLDLDVGAQAEHEPLDDAGEHVRRHDRQQRRRRVELDRLQQHMVQRTEVHVVLGEPLDDQVGSVPEHPGTEHVERGTRDRDHDNDPEHESHRAEHLDHAAHRVLEVLGTLAGDARRVPTTRGARLRRREIEFLALLFFVVV